jgi:DNA-binding transcriptional MerR regulator
MLDYLCRTGIVVPSARPAPGRGRERRYAFGDLLLLKAVQLLLAQGLSVSRLRVGLRNLRRQYPALTPGTLPGRYLVSDGHSLFYRGDDLAIADLTGGGQFVFAFVLEMRRIEDDIVRRCATIG